MKQLVVVCVLGALLSGCAQSSFAARLTEEGFTQVSVEPAPGGLKARGAIANTTCNFTATMPSDSARYEVSSGVHLLGYVTAEQALRILRDQSVPCGKLP